MMSAVTDIVLVPGWGLNSGVWVNLVDQVEQLRPRCRLHLIDLPGYGRAADRSSSEDLRVLAQDCLDQAPKQAVWVGWSLGGMTAMQAAIQAGAERVQGMQLIATNAKFVASSDWQHGVDVDIFDAFADELAGDYSKAMQRFLLLQAGNRHHARALVKALHRRILQYPAPSPSTLKHGIRCLAESDLRNQLPELHVPSQVVIGRRDRVANPSGSRHLAGALDCELIELDSGHAPFITHAEEVVIALDGLIARVERGMYV